MSVLSDEIPLWGLLAIAAAVNVPTGLILADMIESFKFDGECEYAATVWERVNFDGGVYRSSEKAYFSKQYALFRTACPNGHSLVNENKIPVAVKAGFVPATK